MKKKGAIVANKHVTLLSGEIEKASLLSLCKELIFGSSSISQISNLMQHNISIDKENKYLHKMSIIVSIICQTKLLIIGNSLKNFGSKFENYLNGKGFQRKNIEEENEDFISIMAHLDTRMQLNQDIKQGDARYYPALSMMASKLAYENERVIKKTVTQYWKMEYVEFYDCDNEYEKKRATQAFMMQEKPTQGDKIIVAFRGTSAFEAEDWITDFDFSWCKIKGLGMVHKGFITALGLKICSLEDDNLLGDSQGDFPKQINYNKKDPQRLAYYTIKEKLEEIMENNERAKFIVTGHSLGGALAILFPAILAFHGEVKLLNKLEAIYTFGQPRVGDRKFGMFMKRKLRKHNIKYYRIVYGYDIVPRVPFDNVLMMFKHFGTCIHFDSLYHGKIVEEEEIEPVEKKTFLKVYFGALRQAIVFWMCIILGRLTAIWELIRGFMIGFTAGPYYREGWLLIGARIIGMILPEFTDHNPQDYLNATLLASEDLFKYYPTLN